MKLRSYTKPGWNKNSEGNNYEITFQVSEKCIARQHLAGRL